MADPLSAIGTAVGVVSLGIQVTQELLKFYRACRDRESELAGITQRLESLLQIFDFLHDTLKSPSFKAKGPRIVESVEISITNCRDLVQKLHSECDRFRKAENTPFKFKSFRFRSRQAMYPFQQRTILQLDDNINKIRDTISFALNVFQSKDIEDTHQNVVAVKNTLHSMGSTLHSIRMNQAPSYLRDWLKAPDATIDHNTARAKAFPSTGRWLTESSGFSRWLEDPNSLIWVKGFPGSGKSILCSTAIEAVMQHQQRQHQQRTSRVGAACFYFTFNDRSKQDVSSMIRALLVQLSCQLHNDNWADIAQLYDSHTSGTPPPPALLDCLRNLIGKFDNVYLLIDALDESPIDTSREHVLEALDSIRQWGMAGLHMFVTSRDERDIRVCLDLVTTKRITMRNGGIDDDITNFIHGRLDRDRRLQQLLPFRDKIRNTLTEKANGM